MIDTRPPGRMLLRSPAPVTGDDRGTLPPSGRGQKGPFMKRILAILTVTALVAGVVVGDKPDTAPKADAILELSLPESSEPPEYAPERVSKLLIDGKDHSKPRRTERTVAVTLKKGADSV